MLSQSSAQTSKKTNTTDVYAVDKLMAETRRVAAEYRKTTGQALPVSADLARYDCGRLLGLRKPEQVLAGVDLIGQLEKDGEAQRFQVKSRVLFDREKGNYRVGQVNVDGAWDQLLLVLLSEEYQAEEIYQMSRQQILTILEDDAHKKQNKGLMSVAKFKALGQLIWVEE